MKVLVACDNVEVGAGEVAFIFVVRLEHLSRTAPLACGGIAYL
jgi:hypothetical protein